MAKCHRNDVGSLALDRAPTTGTHIRLWNSFSGSAFRRKIFEAVSCGGSSRYRHELREEEEDIISTGAKTNTMRAVLNGDCSERSKPVKLVGDRKVKVAARGGAKSEKLLDLLCLAEVETDVETKRKVDALEELKRVVQQLQVEARVDEKKKAVMAAIKVRSLAKENIEARVTLALLGAIPPLVAMLDDLGDADSQIASLYALLNLGIGNDDNKAAIVKAGAVHKMLNLIGSSNSLNLPVAEAIVANFLGLSALDSNKPIIGSSGAIQFLVKTLKNSEVKKSSQARDDALRALYNLTISSSNIPFIIETGLIHFLLNTLGDMEVSERILSILSNVVSTSEGRKSISISPDAFPILVDILNWTDAPPCQEKATYILMVMAHKSYGDRQAMIEAGIVSSLLELTLLGSTLAQKRASRIMEILRVDKGKQVSENYNSAPICGSSSTSMNPTEFSKNYLVDEEDSMMSEEKKAVKQLVQQSLQNNMRRIVKRANLPQDFVPSDHFKCLTTSSTSKSVPF